VREGVESWRERRPGGKVSPSEGGRGGGGGDWVRYTGRVWEDGLSGFGLVW
jgi:hypothetical protein